MWTLYIPLTGVLFVLPMARKALRVGVATLPKKATWFLPFNSRLDAVAVRAASSSLVVMEERSEGMGNL